ncbi:trypsin-like peptidase domain-containing protein [bacterium]|nr:trypsin-like peptidase domain-containing protein [candidate division CSSED10-310 bacterium]
MPRCTLLVILLLLNAIHAAAQDDVAEYPPRRNAVVQVVDMVGPAVVNISTEKVTTYYADPFYSFAHRYFRDFLSVPRSVEEESLGSGILIDSQGHILTNEHVILPASRIKITLSDKREFTGNLRGASSRFDLAVIRVEAGDPLPYVPLASSGDLMIGETVIAIGNPFGLSHTVTTGVISALNRTIRLDENRVLHDFIQTDASINPGNSGGPLLNIHGRLIGINTAIYKEAQGIGFAIPADKAAQVVADLITLGTVRRAWFGMYVQDLTPRLAAHFGVPVETGVIISSVEEGPAQTAGLRHGDVIVNMNSVTVKSKRGFLDFTSEQLPDTRIAVTYYRDGREQQTTLTPVLLPPDLGETIASEWLGIEVNAMTRELRQRYALRPNTGAVITDIRQDSPAAKHGLKPGDTIIQVNAEEIASPEKLYQAMIRARDMEEVFLVFFRGSYAYKVTIAP